MNSPSLYLSLCTEFFDLDKPTAPAEEYAFYRDYVAQARGSILEPMCGTGRYLIPLLEEGYNVDGFDASPFMLNALRSKCAQKNLNPNVWELFLEDVTDTKKYNLIFIPDSSFCLFLQQEQIIVCLQKIYNLLEIGGTFVFDLETVYAIPSRIGIWQGKVYTRADGKHVMQSILPLPITNNTATVICRYELMDNIHVLKKEMEYFQIKLYYPTEMELFLKEVGFTQIKRVHAYNRTLSPSAHDYTIVYECVK
jgi:SAM-dependent methyltransferase